MQTKNRCLAGLLTCSLGAALMYGYDRQRTTYWNEFERRLGEYHLFRPDKGIPFVFRSNLSNQRKYYNMLLRTEEDFDANLETFLDYVDENKRKIADMVGDCERGGFIDFIEGEFQFTEVNTWKQPLCQYLDQILAHDFTNYKTFLLGLIDNRETILSMSGYESLENMFEDLTRYKDLAETLQSLGRSIPSSEDTPIGIIYQMDYVNARVRVATLLSTLRHAHSVSYRDQLSHYDTLFARYHTHAIEETESKMDNSVDSAVSILNGPGLVFRNIGGHTLIIDANVRNRHSEVYRASLLE